MKKYFLIFLFIFNILPQYICSENSEDLSIDKNSYQQIIKQVDQRIDYKYEHEIDKITIYLTLFSIIISIVGILLAIFGFLGLKSIKDKSNEIKTIKETCNNDKEELERIRTDYSSLKDIIDKQKYLSGILLQELNNAYSKINEDFYNNLGDEVHIEESKINEIENRLTFLQKINQKLSQKDEFLLAVIYYSKNDFEKALLVLDELKSKQKNYQVYFLEGLIYQILEKYDESLSNYRMAVSINPNYYKCLNNMATVCKCTNDYQNGILYAKKSTLIKPKEITGWITLFSLLIDSGKYDEAKVITSFIKKIEPNNSDFKYNLVCLYLCQKNYQEALTTFNTIEDTEKYLSIARTDDTFIMAMDSCPELKELLFNNIKK
jgi:tetratricopeptide (TPR) repeat protein